MDSNVRLPIKIVESFRTDFSRPDSSGGARKVFGEVTGEVRKKYSNQLRDIKQYFSASFKERAALPAVARVVLKKKALAKSHRPSSLFTPNTCPILGSRDFGELFISVTASGLDKLDRKILADPSKRAIANISTIERIEPFTATEAIGPIGVGELKAELMQKVNKVRLRVFIHPSAEANRELLSAFRQHVQDLALPEPQEVSYSKKMKVFRLTKVQPEQIELLAGFVGTQSISPFPRFHFVRPASIPVGKVDANQFPKPDPKIDYPVIGIVDTGVNPNAPILSTWIMNRYTYVPSNQANYEHGSFVAGMAVCGRHLNNDGRFPDYPVKFVDVAALPENGALTEYELLAILEDVLPKHPEIKFWNLSMNSDDKRVGSDTFSYLAMGLDELQAKYNTTIVISAGNYFEMPRRGWPPEQLGEGDRILSPAESVRGVTVGALAHLDRPGTLVQREQPSPFSRRGPGAAFLPKPDLTHYGGNCNADLVHTQVGVRSFDGQGNIAESIGTSFSTPLVTSILANIDKSIRNGTTPCLIRALAVHSAVLDRTDLTPQELKYRGFGIPGDLTSILTCYPWEATLIFEPELREGFNFDKYPFPFPPCLFKEDKKLTGEVVMTLAYDPPLDANAGAEYCRVNVNASLGTCEIGSDNRPSDHCLQVHPQPRKQDLTALYESYQIEHGFKWSPLKVYRRRMPRGVTGEAWNLKLTMLTRSDYTVTAPQKVALVVTMRDPNREAPVYDEAVTFMRNIGWVTQDLQVEERIRLQA